MGLVFFLYALVHSFILLNKSSVSLKKKLHLNNIQLDIADVTNFVHPGTPLDDEAAQRGTSVYLVERRIDMLPKPLTEGPHLLL